MALFLVQHGKSLPSDIDPERGLSPEGVSEVERIASAAKDHGICVSSIEHSGKKRARQTAEIFASALEPDNGVQERGGLSPLDDVVPVAREVKGEDDLMLVGHLPFMERLTSFLITGQSDKTVLAFQNGGIVCLDQSPETRAWVIKWALLPTIA